MEVRRTETFHLCLECGDCLVCSAGIQAPSLGLPSQEQSECFLKPMQEQVTLLPEAFQWLSICHQDKIQMPG